MYSFTFFIQIQCCLEKNHLYGREEHALGYTNQHLPWTPCLQSSVPDLGRLDTDPDPDPHLHWVTDPELDLALYFSGCQDVQVPSDSDLGGPKTYGSGTLLQGQDKTPAVQGLGPDCIKSTLAGYRRLWHRVASCTGV
jgi:hypothetical protein